MEQKAKLWTKDFVMVSSIQFFIIYLILHADGDISRLFNRSVPCLAK